MTKTEKRMKTESNCGAETEWSGPVLMERLQGGRGIVRVGDIVTPFGEFPDVAAGFKTGQEWTVKAISETRITLVNCAGVEQKTGNQSDWRLTSRSELQARAQLRSLTEKRMTKLEPFDRIEEKPVAGPILPIIHMNGTSAQMLLNGYRDAMNAIREAQDVLGRMEFNARDYYPEDGLWPKAVKERHDMLEQLARIHEDLQAIAIHCMSHVNKRGAK